MPQQNYLNRLREIRRQLAEAKAVVPERDRLVVEALKAGHSHRKVAAAAGISATRVHEIRSPTDR
jgi:DNA-directed RNA polymerase specialized sigma subunit